MARMDWPSAASSWAASTGPLAGLGVALAEEWDDDLLDQPELAVGSVAEEAQVARLDPVGPERRQPGWPP